jgi:hypothetical protein
VEGFVDRNTMFIVEVQWFGTTIAVETAVCTLHLFHCCIHIDGGGCGGSSFLDRNPQHMGTAQDHDRSRSKTKAF